MRVAALRSALSHRLAEGDITVVETLAIDEYKTKRVLEILRGLSLSDTRVLIILDTRDEYLERSTRNIPGVQVLPVEGLNVFDVLRYQKLLVTKPALAAIETRLAGQSKESNS
jgi:large subunit ribosomal protein L4